MTLRFKPTRRGLIVARFADRYGKMCSIQRSSIAGDSCIWLGRDRAELNAEGEPTLARMHLDRRLVRELLPALTLFASEGRLPNEPEPAAEPQGAADGPP